MANKLNIYKLRNDIEEYLDKNDMSLRKFSDKCGLNVSLLSRFLREEYNPGMRMINRLLDGLEASYMDYYECSYDDLTIEELTDLLHKIKDIRDKKIIKCIASLNKEIAELESLQKEEL